MSYRIGIGYDIHRLSKKKKLILGGVTIPNSMGLLGHSDADVLLHAVIDALLGAAGDADIGELFPDTDRRFKGACSLELLKKVHLRLKKKKIAIINIDAVIILEEPKISPYKDMIRGKIARCLALGIGRINLKAKTNEGLGEAGRKQAIAVYAVALVRKAG